MEQTSKQLILGVKIDAINMVEAINRFDPLNKPSTSRYVCCVPIHSIMDCYESEAIKNAVNSSWLNTPDGMGVVWLLKLFGHGNVSRVYGPELMKQVCKNYPHLRHFLLGGTDKILIRLVQNLRQISPDLNIVGSNSPVIDINDLAIDQELFKLIHDCSPDVIWVGLGSPKQELWMQKNYEIFSNVIMVGVGAAFDFLSGSKKQAPNWIQRIGFEWFFRFLQEPKRLWRRYKKYPFFILLVFMQLIGIKDYS